MLNNTSKWYTNIYKHLINPANFVAYCDFNEKVSPGIGASVYFVYDKKKLCYVGESGNLFERFMDLNRTLNHSFRRSLGNSKFINHVKFSKATTKIKFHEEIESLLNKYCNRHLTISYMPMILGRLEFEEWVTGNSKNYILLNKKKKRKQFIHDV